MGDELPGEGDDVLWAALSAQADAYLRSRNAERLRSTAAELVACDPTRPEGYAFHAEAHRLEGNHKAAVELQRTALEQDPDHLGLLCRLGSYLYMAGAYEEAEAVLRRVIAGDPEWSHAWTELAEVFYWAHDETATAAALERALALDPENEDALHLKARAAQAFADAVEDETLAAFHVALEADPEDAWIHGNLGREYQRRREWALAEHHLRESLRLEPDLKDYRQPYYDVLKRRYRLFAALTMPAELVFRGALWCVKPRNLVVFFLIYFASIFYDPAYYAMEAVFHVLISGMYVLLLLALPTLWAWRWALRPTLLADAAHIGSTSRSSVRWRLPGGLRLLLPLSLVAIGLAAWVWVAMSPEGYDAATDLVELNWLPLVGLLILVTWFILRWRRSRRRKRRLRDLKALDHG